MKAALVYIAGYITRNDNQPSECETNFYYEKYGKYSNLTDCGKLKVPPDHICQWLFFVSFFSIQQRNDVTLSNILCLFLSFLFSTRRKSMPLSLQI